MPGFRGLWHHIDRSRHGLAGVGGTDLEHKVVLDFVDEMGHTGVCGVVPLHQVGEPGDLRERPGQRHLGTPHRRERVFHPLRPPQEVENWATAG